MKKLYLILFFSFCIIKISNAQAPTYSTTYYATSLWQNDKTTVNSSWRSNQNCVTLGKGGNATLQCPSGGYNELKAQDGEFAVCDYSDDETKFIMATDFKINFNNLPVGLTRDNIEIKAIELRVEKYASIRDIQDNQVRVIKHGEVNYTGFNVGESDKAKKAVAWPTSATVITYGGENDPYPLWGTTWTLEDLEREDFGMAISAVKPKAQNRAESYIGMIALRIVYAQKPQVLPVELIRFNAKPEAAKVVLSWATASEKNNDYFSLEKSADGKEFKTIATIKGIGNSSQITEYQYADETYTPKTAYYRLKQTDFDGTFAYSAIISVNTKGNFEPVLSVYPNPSDGRDLKLTANFLQQAPTELKLYSQTGALIHRSEIPVTTETVIELNQLANLPPGIYIITATQQDLQLRQKVVVR